MECARTLYRRKATLLWIAFFGIIAATLFSVAQPRTYQSQASIQIQGINENFLNLRDIYPTAAPSADNAVYVQTQAEMLQQDALIQQVVQKLRLEERPEYRSGASLWDRFRPADRVRYADAGRPNGGRGSEKELADRVLARQQHHPDRDPGA